MFFFFNDTATTEIYTLSLHDALPILIQWNAHPAIKMSKEKKVKRNKLIFGSAAILAAAFALTACTKPNLAASSSGNPARDRKSTRLNSSHQIISYAVFCLKKKNLIQTQISKGVLASTSSLTSALIT